MKPHRAALLLVLVGAACAADERTREADIAAVYESFLDDHCCPERVILQEVTDTAGLVRGARRWSDEEEMKVFSADVRQALADLSRQSRTVRPLPDSLSMTSRDRRMSAGSVRALLERMRRDHTHRLQNRETVVLISAVGFSDDQKLAAVRIVQVCGTLCGGVTVRALRRHPGGWVPAEEIFSAVF